MRTRVFPFLYSAWLVNKIKNILKSVIPSFIDCIENNRWWVWQDILYRSWGRFKILKGPLMHHLYCWRRKYSQLSEHFNHLYVKISLDTINEFQQKWLVNDFLFIYDLYYRTPHNISPQQWYRQKLHPHKNKLLESYCFVTLYLIERKPWVWTPGELAGGCLWGVCLLSGFPPTAQSVNVFYRNVIM